MAARLLAFAALPPLLLQPARGVSESDIYNDGRKHVPVAVLAERWRQLEATRCQGQDAQPLLWQASVSNRTVYLLATYPVPQEDMLPMQPQVQNAIECADIAYFELACAPKDMGNYMAHCFHYNAAEAHDSVPQRIPPSDMQELQAAVSQLAASAPPECAALAANLTRSAQALNASRQTLRAFYQQALRVLHPSECKRKAGVLMYQGNLRQAFGSARPVFGLRDIATECAVFAGSSEEEDTALARKMATEFSNVQWRANLTSNQEAMEDILHCGDLGRLKSMPGIKELPGLGEWHLGQRNPMLADSIVRGVQENPGKTILVVLGITHFLDFGTTKSVTTLLQEKGGFTFQRVTTGTELGCTQSSYSAPGAKELGTCLLPPGRSQPASCTAFNQAFDSAEAAVSANYPTPNKTLGVVSMGRRKNKTQCFGCVHSPESCECEVTWQNTTDFGKLCNGTTADGVRGMVVYMDLTRNPGSVQKGPGLSEKYVKGLGQLCLATSCDLGFRQEIALRHWYAESPQLAGGIVTLRYPGQHVDMYQGTGAFWSFSSWPWWAWAIFVCLLGLCIAGLIKVFMMPRRKKAVKRAMQIGDPQLMRAPEVENHFQKVDTEAQRMEDRYPEPSRYDAQQSWQPMQQQQQQQQMLQQQQQQQLLQDEGYPPPPALGGGIDDGWPVPQPGTRAYAPDVDPFAKGPGPSWQPQLDWNPQPDRVEQASPFQAFDNTILSQAMQMQQQLGDAGAQAVQQMQQQALANWQRQNMLPGQQLPTGGSYSLQPPPPTQMAAFGGQPGQPPFSGPPLSGSGPPLGGMGVPGQLYGPGSFGAPIFGAPPGVPASPPRGLSGQMFQPMGQAGAGAGPGMPFPYARLA